MVGYYYAFLVYTSLSKEPQKMETNWEEITHVTVERAHSWTNELPEMVTNKPGIQHEMCIVPAPFRVKNYINEAWYLPGDTTLETEMLKNQGILPCSFRREALHHHRKILVVLEFLLFKRFVALLSARSL